MNGRHLLGVAVLVIGVLLVIFGMAAFANVEHGASPPVAMGVGCLAGGFACCLLSWRWMADPRGGVSEEKLS